MLINPRSNSPIRPEASAPVTKPEPVASQPGKSAPAQQRGDEVQISDAGRARASQRSATPGLTPERTAEVRQRILDGAYNSIAVVDEVARRILGSGDLN